MPYANFAYLQDNLQTNEICFSDDCHNQLPNTKIWWFDLMTEIVNELQIEGSIPDDANFPNEKLLRFTLTDTNFVLNSGTVLIMKFEGISPLLSMKQADI